MARNERWRLRAGLVWRVQGFALHETAKPMPIPTIKAPFGRKARDIRPDLYNLL